MLRRRARLCLLRLQLTRLQLIRQSTRYLLRIAARGEFGRRWIPSTAGLILGTVSGYEIWQYGKGLPIAGISPACAKTRDVNSLSTIYMTELQTVLVHAAWHISWEKSDTSTLSPPPPTLTNDMIINTVGRLSHLFSLLVTKRPYARFNEIA